MRLSLGKMILTVMIAFSCAFAPTAVVAQDVEDPQSTVGSHESAYDEYFMSDEHRQRIYDESKKSHGTAALWTLAFPGLGNIYAEQYMLAGMAMIFMVFAGTFVGYGISTKQRGIIVLGGITAGIAYGGGLGTSLHGVTVYNRKLRQGLKVQEADVRETWTPTLTLRF